MLEKKKNAKSRQKCSAICTDNDKSVAIKNVATSLKIAREKMIEEIKQS